MIGLGGKGGGGVPSGGQPPSIGDRLGQLPGIQQGVQAGQDFAGNLRELASMFLGNQGGGGQGGGQLMPTITQPMRPPPMLTRGDPGLQQAPMAPPAQAGPMQPAMAPQGFMDQLEAIRNPNRMAMRRGGIGR